MFAVQVNSIQRCRAARNAHSSHSGTPLPTPRVFRCSHLHVSRQLRAPGHLPVTTLAASFAYSLQALRRYLRPPAQTWPKPLLHAHEPA